MEFIVSRKAERPAGKQNECFYCHQAVGTNHKPDCALIQRKVRINVTIALSYEVDYGVAMTKDNINFHRNDSSWCADNALDELKEAISDTCLCSFATFQYVRDEGEPFLNEYGDYPANNADFQMIPE